MIEVLNLNAAYDKKPVLWNVSCQLPKGEMIGVIGPNGAGKSTLLKAIVGLIEPLSGSVKVSDKIAYVGQRNEVDWDFPVTVYEVACMGLIGQLGFWKRMKKHDRETVLEALKKLGLDQVAHRQISELSGGQQRRLFVVRALLQKADIYLLDEPFAAIDMTTEKLLIEIFRDLTKQGKTVIVVHHDLLRIKEYFSYLVMLNIHLVTAGPTNQVFHYENFSKTFGDQVSILEEALKLTDSKKQGV